MYYVNYSPTTFQITSIGEKRSDHAIEISSAYFKKIMSGEIQDLFILKHPKKNVFVLSETEYFSWFKWANHDTEITSEGFKIKLPFVVGDRIVLSKTGEGNVVYAVYTVEEDVDEFLIDFENPSLKTIDIFVSTDYANEKV
jgi:hypothetical protein